jgi:hypothetical protein
MPNWCYNALKVMGEASEMKRFKEIGIEVVDGEPVWSMGKYFPTPEPLTRTISPSSSAKGKEFTNEWEIESAKKRVANGEVGVEIPVSIPCANNSPEACAKLIAEFGFDEWYGWNVANWGTKWDCNTRHTGIETNEDTVLQVSFDSAWSPPIKWLDKVQKDFPTLNFKLTFSEEGCGFCGMVYTGEVEEEGEIRQLEEEEGEYLYSDEDGNACHYDAEKEGWVNSETGELYLNDEGEKDDDFYPESKNSIEDYIVWFEEEV